MRLNQAVNRGRVIRENPGQWQIKPEPPPTFHHTPPIVIEGPTMFMMSPLPGVTVATDNLRQFNRFGGIPQTRILSPKPL